MDSSSARAGRPRRGILAGGNWIVDHVKLIDTWPRPESLANILGQQDGTGGAPYNTLLALAKMGAEFPLAGAGLVGRDVEGNAILGHCKQHRIDAGLLRQADGAHTSYTDVMTERAGGRRTFFHCRGANALWDGGDIDFRAASARIFHLGYLLLLDALDQPDAIHGTRAGRLLAAAQAAGLKTSVDVVSENGERFAAVVKPALRHTDYCILNEIEAGKTCGIEVRDAQGRLNPAGIVQAAAALLALGVREVAVIHFPEGAHARNAAGESFWQPSLKLPEGYIAGSAGAGDAFCAGMLLGLHEGWALGRCLLTGTCAAAASMADATCTAGIVSLAGCLELAAQYEFRPAQEMGLADSAFNAISDA